MKEIQIYTLSELHEVIEMYAEGEDHYAALHSLHAQATAQQIWRAALALFPSLNGPNRREIDDGGDDPSSGIQDEIIAAL